MILENLIIKDLLTYIFRKIRKSWVRIVFANNNVSLTTFIRFEVLMHKENY